MKHFYKGLTLLFTLASCSLASATGSALDPRSVWDGEGPTPAYVSETWPDAPVLTWANPGVSGELNDPANWLHDGKPSNITPNETTDIILPAADQRYTVRAGKQKVRHVDIGNRAELQGKHRGETEIWGNCLSHECALVLYVSFNCNFGNAI